VKGGKIVNDDGQYEDIHIKYVGLSTCDYINLILIGFYHLYINQIN